MEEAAEGFAETAAWVHTAWPFLVNRPGYRICMGEQKAADKAEEDKRATEEAKEEMRDLEEGDPPEDLEDWPGGKAKYITYGGPDTESGYDDGPTAKLGPADLEHKEDGSVEIGGEPVDDPEDYKGDPIPGGPTDDDARGESAE
jgi:hypothetical protein